MSDLIKELMLQTPTGTLEGNATFITGSPSYLRLTQASGSQTGRLDYSISMRDTFWIEGDIYANGSADAIYAYWGCSSVPTSEDGIAGGYVVAFDEFTAEIQLKFDGANLKVVSFASLGNATRRQIVISVNQQTIRVFVSGDLVLEYIDTRRTLPGNHIGIGARTGGSTAEHRIYSWYVYDDVVAADPPNIPTVRHSKNLNSRYSCEILNRSGQVIAEFSGRAKERSLHFVRNGTYEAEWSLDIDSVEQYARDINVNARSLFSVGQNQVRIKRLGVTLFTGQLMYHESEVGESKNLHIRATGWFDLFLNRFTSIEKSFSSGTDRGQIAWTLIDESQMLDEGSYDITQGTIQASSSIPADIVYENKSVREAIIQLAASGFDFEITPEKVFNVFYPKMGVERTEFQFIFPGNIKKLKISTDANTLVNYALVRGQGFGDGQMIDIREDAESQASYGLRQAILDFSDIPDIETLQALGDEEIRTLKDPLEIIQVTLDGNQQPFIGGYWLGDTVQVITQNMALYEHINGFYRIDEINLNIDDEDNEEVELKMMK